MKSPSLKKQSNPFSALRAQRANMDPRLQHRERFISKEHFPATEGKNETGYQLWITPFALDALQSIPGAQVKVEIKRTIVSLSALPRALTHLQNRHVINIYKAPVGRHLIQYAINNGRVTVYDIDFNDKTLSQKNKKELPKLYHVKKTPGGWTTRGLTESKAVTTRLAAINGQSNNLKKATWLMAEHLQYHHGKAFNEYTLFHNPTEGGLRDTWESMRDKMHKTTEVSMAFSRVLKNVQSSGQPVNWIAHSQGAIIFCESTRILLNKGMKKLDKNSVIFDAGAASRRKTDQLMKNVGIRSKHNSAPNDFVHQIAGGNAASIGQVLASALHLPRLFFGTTESSAHTLAYKGKYNRAASLKYGVKQPGLVKKSINALATRFWNY